MTKTFEEYLEQYQKMSGKRDKGTLFEEAIIYFFKNDRIKKEEYKDCWTWAEYVDYKQKNGFDNVYDDKKDDGIDLVAVTHDKQYHAIQCKFYNFNKKLGLDDLKTFLSSFGSDKGRLNFAQGIIVDTAADWTDVLEKKIAEYKTIKKIGLNEINKSNLNWDAFFNSDQDADKYQKPKTLYKYQQEAFDGVINGFKATNDNDQPVTRGKLIMACGTGKTFVSLKIFEELCPFNSLVLFVVPSLALINQTVREWANQQTKSSYKFAICSDSSVGKKKRIQEQDYDANESLKMSDLEIPSDTDPQRLVNAIQEVKNQNNVVLEHERKNIVIFSTYQSLDKISQAQKKFDLPKFDLIICDEAHRTATIGKTKDKDNSFYTKIHHNRYITSSKRLYMTATPKLYLDNVKSVAKEAEVELYSMDDKKIFGETFFTYSFADAIRDERLTDYRIILAIIDKKEKEEFDKTFKDLEYIKSYSQSLKSSQTKKRVKKEKTLHQEDLYKLFSVYKMFSKISISGKDFADIQDPKPMQKVMGFTSLVKISQDIETIYPKMITDYCKIKDADDEKFVRLNTFHIDGGITGKKREVILKNFSKTHENVCNLITNVDCLSEGVDVPTLDGVVFFHPRQSEINIIQCIGRVLRKAKDKKWGYIMLPIFVDPGESIKNPATLLERTIATSNNKQYKLISKVINSLKAMDETFNVGINKLILNPKASIKDSKIILSIGGKIPSQDQNDAHQTSLEIEADVLRNQSYVRAIKALLIKKADQSHWEDWVNETADKTKLKEREIKKLLRENEIIKEAFKTFHHALKKNIYQGILRSEAIEMITQHLVTKRIFDVAFENVNGKLQDSNVIAQGLEVFVEKLKEQGLDIEHDETFNNFYLSVESKMRDLKDDHDAKINLLHQIYETFFTKAFPEKQSRLGIVYTPSEIINFMLNSVEYLLNKEFKTKLENENVSIIDPFTGTGSFLAKLILSNLISQDKLLHKYQNEIFANEILLLPYYIAFTQISSAFYSKTKKHLPFNNLILTDTFEAYEDEYQKEYLLDSKMIHSLYKNYQRLNQQKLSKIKVIIGNPPYSVSSDANLDNQNKKYHNLEKEITNTYSALSNAKNRSALYNSYVKAIKWASLRLQNVDQGIIAFITPNGFIDGISYDGMRKILSEEFAHIYIYDCKGDQYKFRGGHKDQGNEIFNGVQTGVAMTFFVKNRKVKEQGQIHYYTFDEALKQKEKLAKINDLGSIEGVVNIMDNNVIDEHDAWIHQDKSLFADTKYYLPLREEKMGSRRKNNSKTLYKHFIFKESSCGIQTSRNAWCCNFSKTRVETNIKKTIEHYNKRRIEFHSQENKNVKSFLKNENKKDISLNKSIKTYLKNNTNICFNINHLIFGLIRPYSSSFIYYDKHLNGSRYQIPKFFSNLKNNTLGIVISKQNPFNTLSALVINNVFEHSFINHGIFFPLNYINENSDHSLIKGTNVEVITDDVLQIFQYPNNKITKKMIFYYIYGLLHHKSYATSFSNALRNQLPRIPKVKDYKLFHKFYETGKALANIHLNYETYQMWQCNSYDPYGKYQDDDFKINKSIKIPKVDNHEDLSTIIYNHKFTISNIPLEVYNYKLMNKPVIKLFLDKWKDKTDSASGIRNNPNDYPKETGQPRYILETLLRVINIALATNKLINDLPEVDWNNKEIFERIN